MRKVRHISEEAEWMKLFSRRYIRLLVPLLAGGAALAAVACGSDTVETVIQTVIVEREVAGETIVQTVEVDRIITVVNYRVM